MPLAIAAIVIIVIVIVGTYLLAWSLCVVAARSDEDAERQLGIRRS